MAKTIVTMLPLIKMIKIIFIDKMITLSHIQQYCSRRHWKHGDKNLKKFSIKDSLIVKKKLKTLWPNEKLLIRLLLLGHNASSADNTMKVSKYRNTENLHKWNNYQLQNELKTLWQKEKMLIMGNFFFCWIVSKVVYSTGVKMLR